MEYNVLTVSQYGIILNVVGHFNINGVIYKDPVASARLLTLQELERISHLDLKHPVARMQVEEDIATNVFHSFVGISDYIDWDKSEAGLLETIVNAIILTSTTYLTDPISKIENISSSIGVVNSMQAVVSRFMSTPYTEVEKLPINEVFRRYAICMMAFPKEVSPLIENDGEEE